MSDYVPKFKLNNKTYENYRLHTKCMVLTYSSDIGISLGLVIEHLQQINLTLKNKMTGFVAHCFSDEKCEHDHFHAFIEIKSNKDMDFTDAHSIFDIPLKEPYLVFIKEDKTRDYKSFSDCVKQWNIKDTNDPYIDEFCVHSGYKNWNVIDKAVANFAPRKDYGSVWHMIKYIWKDNEIISARIDWPYTVEERLEKEYNKLNKKQKKSADNELKVKDQMEYDMSQWLRDKIVNDKLTKSEIRKQIMENPKYSYIYISKAHNYEFLLDTYFKEKPIEKPPPHWGRFIIPKALRDYLLYLDNWVKDWHTKDHALLEKRPKPLYLQGKGGSGKTSLIASLGDFSYWCNTWSFNNYESLPAFNFMDDYDTIVDYKGNQTDAGFSYLKPWFGGQQVVTISGKYKQPQTVHNGRPLVFVSNNRFEERFPNPNDRKYLHDIGITVVELGEKDLYSPKCTRTIGDLINWVEFDTRDTWWYKNKIAPQIDSFVSTIYSGEKKNDNDVDREVNLPRHRKLSELNDSEQCCEDQHLRKKKKSDNN